MRQIMIVLALAALVYPAAALTVQAVNAQDLAPNSHRVEILLSAPGSYSVQKLPGGLGLRVYIDDVESFAAQPNYPRLSELLDRITVYTSGDEGVVEIKTMEVLPFRHAINPNRTRITVTINPALGSAPAKVAKTPARPATPAPTPTVNPAVEPTPKPDSATVQASPRTRGLGVQPDSVLVVRKTVRTWRCPLWASFGSCGLPLWPLLLLALGLLLLVLGLLGLFRRKKPAGPVRKVTKPTGENTLLMDSETRKRMVQRLMDQGWSTEEIARELKVGVPDVERIIEILRETPPEHGN